MRIVTALLVAACLLAAPAAALARQGNRKECDAGCTSVMGVCSQCCYKTFMANPEYARCFRGETDCRSSCDPFEPSCARECTRTWVNGCQDKVILEYDCK